MTIRSWFDKLPRVSRLTAAREILATFPLGIVSAVLGTGFCGFIARKALHMPDKTLSMLLASQFVGFLIISPIVGLFSHTRKIRILAGALLILSISMISIIFTEPATIEASATNELTLQHALFIAQIFIAQLCIGLVITLRSSIWRANYPDNTRARFVVIINLCSLIVGSTSVLLFSSLMEHAKFYFCDVYFISGFAGIIAALLFMRIRIRRENAMLRNLTQKPSAANARLLAGLTVLAQDRRFRIFMSWQMLNGLSTMLVEVVLIVILADVFKSNWLIGGSALAAIPLFVSAIASLLWSKLFDQSNIFKMRFYGALIWSISRTILGISILLFILGQPRLSILALLTSRVVSGIAMGCGSLAWRLGHMEFAPAHQDSLYMGAHISLTGIRGIIAPFLGLFLYHLTWLGSYGIGLIFITAACQFICAIAFRVMPRYIGHKPVTAD